MRPVDPGAAGRDRENRVRTGRERGRLLVGGAVES